MSKIKNKFNREERRKLVYKSKVKMGCFLAALSLAVLTAGTGQVQAADMGKDTEKKIVSENKTKPDKKKSAKKKADAKGEDGQGGRESVTEPTQAGEKPLFQATAGPQVTESPKSTESLKPSETPGTHKGSENDGAGKEGIPEGETEDIDEDTKQDIDDINEDTDDMTQDLETDGEGPSTAETPGSTISDNEGTGEDIGEDSVPDGESGSIEGSAQPSPAEDIAVDDSGIHIEDTEEIPVAGVLEGASTVIVGGLAPAVPVGSQGQEQVNKEENDGEVQSRIAGSTPLVGGAIAGEGTGSSTPKDTVTPTAAPSRAPASSVVIAGSRTAVTTYPTATASPSQQGERVAMNDTSTVRDDRSTGLQRTGVATEDPTRIVPFVLAGAAALIAIVALAILKIKKGRDSTLEE